MIDTIRFRVPLTENQYNRIFAIAEQSDVPQFVRLSFASGDMQFLRIKGLVDADLPSYHRKLAWDISPHYVDGKCFLNCELSLPKLWYGHNIALLYDWPAALKELGEWLNKQFGFGTRRSKLPSIEEWQVSRVDACYAWRFPSQSLCHQYLDSLKRIHFPRKRPVIHPTSIEFRGSTYSLKFYEKLPEISARGHDLDEYRKQGANWDWIDHLKRKADGVLRFEATLRRQYLQRQGINTVKDLLEPQIKLELKLSNDFEASLLLEARWEELSEEEVHEAKVLLVREIIKENALAGKFEKSGNNFLLPLGQTISYKGIATLAFIAKDKLTATLDYFINKFLGGNQGMQTVDQVQICLEKVFKPVKTARLVSFWLYTRQFGTQTAKQNFGENSYYYNRRELKKAGVDLVELPENVIPLEKDFLSRFKLEVPSEFVVNGFDDYRNSDNLLNLPVRSVSS